MYNVSLWSSHAHRVSKMNTSDHQLITFIHVVVQNLLPFRSHQNSSYSDNTFGSRTCARGLPWSALRITFPCRSSAKPRVCCATWRSASRNTLRFWRPKSMYPNSMPTYYDFHLYRRVNLFRIRNLSQ